MRPGCPHYIRKELVVGKIAQCWRCGCEVVMTPGMAKMKKPHCAKCTRPATGVAGDNAA